MRKIAFVAGAVACVAAAAFAPAHAEPPVVGPQGVQAAEGSVAAPESPIAAFERLFAAAGSAAPAAAAPVVADPLDAPFRAALWSPPAPSRLASAVRRPGEVRR